MISSASGGRAVASRVEHALRAAADEQIGRDEKDLPRPRAHAHSGARPAASARSTAGIASCACPRDAPARRGAPAPARRNPSRRQPRRRQQLLRPVAQRPAQPGVDRHAEAHLRPVDQMPRHVAVEHLAQAAICPAPPRIFSASGSVQANPTTRWSSSGTRPSSADRHGGAVDLGQDVVGQIGRPCRGTACAATRSGKSRGAVASRDRAVRLARRAAATPPAGPIG